MVIPNFIFGQKLNKELVKISEAPLMYQLGIRRIEQTDNTGELQLMTKALRWNQPVSLEADHLEKAVSLRAIIGITYRSRLIKLLTESEQSLIDAHVKAYGYTGLVK